MNKYYSKNIDESVYEVKLDNGLTILVYPRKNINKKYVIWAVNFGSIDNSFIVPGETEVTTMPDGIAHYLEHKMFEQKDKPNSLDTLASLGVDANAFTSNTMTAYLIECKENFEEALTEFMDYVQNPYYTDENVEKERGIISQEIMMYDDYPEEKLYMNLLNGLYINHPIKIDVAGTVDTIMQIDPEKLYKNYNTFYRLDNMVMAVCGDFDVKNIVEKINSKITTTANSESIKRNYPEEPQTINQKHSVANKDISMPIFMIGYKDVPNLEDVLKKSIAIDIIDNIIIGPSSDLHKKLYDEGLIFSPLNYDYEYSKTYAHALIQGTSSNPTKVIELIKQELENYKTKGFTEEEFNRSKNKLYSDIVKSYDEISNVGNNLVSNHFKGIKPFTDFEEFDKITIEYIKQMLDNIFIEEKQVDSIVYPIEK